MNRPKHELDLLVISPGNNKIIYQELSKQVSAIEPPIWAALIANFVRHKGYSTMIIDQEAEGLTAQEISIRANDCKPKLVTVVVYGQQPSASTQNMTAALEICSTLKEHSPHLKIVMVGGHVSALPEKTLSETRADFVCQGEGPLTIQGLLNVADFNDEAQLKKIPGLWFRSNGHVVSTPSAPVIPQEQLSTTLPGMAWDLLPMDNYKACNWHCFEHIHERQPYASLYTSLGCPYRCTFCCINAPFGKSSFRYWDPEFTVNQLDILVHKYHVRSIKIADEMFVLNPNHFLKICDLIIERKYNFNFWAYARIDTVRDRYLEKLKKAGVNWLCLGIESASKYVRDGAQKGKFGEDNIYDIVKKIRDAGIYVIANFIFGLPDDDLNSMQATLDMALELNCEMANFYCGMAYPGSQLYWTALEKKWALPSLWHDFSQHSYGTLPLPTEHLTAGEVLAFRDKAWNTYFTNPNYIHMIRKTFGEDVVEHINYMTSITLKRKYAANIFQKN